MKIIPKTIVTGQVTVTSFDTERCDLNPNAKSARITLIGGLPPLEIVGDDFDKVFPPQYVAAIKASLDQYVIDTYGLTVDTTPDVVPDPSPAQELTPS